MERRQERKGKTLGSRLSEWRTTVYSLCSFRLLTSIQPMCTAYLLCA